MNGGGQTHGLHIGVLGIYHETNCFSTVATDISNFQQEWVVGDEAFHQRYSNTKTAMGGAIDSAAMEHAALLSGLYTAAMPSGTVTGEAAEYLMNELIASVPSGIDGLLVILHGAMVPEGYPDMEKEIVTRLRAAAPYGLPIAITLDLHANISPQMVEQVDVIVGYNTYPHVDIYDCAVEAVRLLAQVIRSEIRPTSHYVHTRMLIAPQAMVTSQGTMKEMMDAAFEMESEDKVLNVTVAGGFPYSDTPDAGMSFVVTTDGDPLLAERLANQLRAKAWEAKERFVVKEMPVEDAIRIALKHTEGPILFIEGSDNVGGGAPADATHVLKRLPELPCKSLIMICDPEAVHLAHQTGVRQSLECYVGGKTDELHGKPVRIKGNIRLLFDGRFRHVGPYMTGRWADMGRTAVVEDGQCTMILTERRTAPWDVGHVIYSGVSPLDYHVIVVKSAVAWRTAFGAYAKAEIYLDTPGCCSANLQHFHYQQVQRPIYPLENDL